jgi:peptidoglycan/LPS O-acetylase OafA/YrhL
MNNPAALRIREDATADLRSATGEQARRVGFIDSLRTFLTLLVVAHHAVLAYYPYAPVPAGDLTTQPRLWPAFPVVDPHRWQGVDLFVGFNDTFFMSLMFLISGLFVAPSLAHKGGRAFLRDRARRLGVPFLVVALLSPLAYHPAFLQRTPEAGFSAFLAQWLSLGSWPSGPAWFVWLLLAFDALAAALLPRCAPRLNALVLKLRRPAIFFLALLTFSAAAYLPLAVLFDGLQWVSFGPFSFQLSRIVHYAVYFTAGIALGTALEEQSILAAGGPLSRRWPVWCVGALFAYAVAVGLFVAGITHDPSAAGWKAAMGLGFTLSCAAASLAFLAVFRRFSRSGGPGAFDRNAYGIYLFHYFFVSWSQYWLLRADLPGSMKAAIVFSIAAILSLVATVVLRRLPWVAKTI